MTPDSLPHNYTDHGSAVQSTKGERPFSIRQTATTTATTSVQGSGLADYEREYLVNLLAAFPIRSLADLVMVRDGVATIRADIPLNTLSLEDACTLQGLAVGGRLPEPPVGMKDEFIEAIKPAAPHVLGSLTGRQRDVLGLLRQGKSNREISAAFGLTEGTVKIHVTAILKALGAQNRTHAVMIAGPVGREG